mmetsp:Transcript_12275/g.14094  ORF Transcript_12275/g.14094 Transcript_12275/m.14094 type:complete len:434 (-) Transcript_12275:69-1370(-)
MQLETLDTSDTSDETSALPHPQPSRDRHVNFPRNEWRWRPELHWVICALSIVCVWLLYTSVSRVDRVATDSTERLAEALGDLCSSRLPLTREESLVAGHDAPAPPPLIKRVVFSWYRYNAESYDADHILNGGAAPNAILDATARFQGKLLHQAMELGRRWRSNPVTGSEASSGVRPSPHDVPRVNPLVVEASSTQRHIQDPATSLISALRASDGSAVAEYWRVSLHPLKTHLSGSPFECRAAPEDRWIVCSISVGNDDAMPENGNTTVTILSAVQRATVAALSVVMGLSGEETVASWLLERQSIACRQAVRSSSRLLTMLHAVPSMPLPLEIGSNLRRYLNAVRQKISIDEDQSASDDLSSKGLVYLSNKVYALTSDPRLIPQVHMPVEQVVVVHFSFLTPLLLGLIGSTVASLRAVKLRRKRLLSSASIPPP